MSERNVGSLTTVYCGSLYTSFSVDGDHSRHYASDTCKAPNSHSGSDGEALFAASGSRPDQTCKIKQQSSSCLIFEVWVFV
jgi:hypothetical protein